MHKKHGYHGVIGLRTGVAYGRASAWAFGVRSPVYYSVEGDPVQEATHLANEASDGKVLLSAKLRARVGNKLDVKVRVWRGGEGVAVQRLNGRLIAMGMLSPPRF